MPWLRYGLGILLLAFVLSVTYSNCSQFEVAHSPGLSLSSTALAPTLSSETCQQLNFKTAPVPPDGAIVNRFTDVNCFSNAAANACLFWKNPVAQKDSELSYLPVRGLSEPQQVNPVDIRARQVFPVQIKGLTNGKLENESLQIRSGTRPRLSNLSQLKFEYEVSDPDRKVGQLMAFYWLSQQMEIMKSRTGVFYAEGTKVDVDVAFVENAADVQNAYFRPDYNSLALGKLANGTEFGLGAEVYAHEMGHANVFWATVNKGPGLAVAGDFHSGTSKKCGEDVCCLDVRGCIGAIGEGLADHHSRIMFGTGPLGEFALNSRSGLSDCGVYRDSEKVRGMTSAQLFQPICSGGQSGEIHRMGNLYASAWWELRSRTFGRAADTKDIDQLFSLHLAEIQADDNFLTVREKILNLDRVIFGGKYHDLILCEFHY